MSRTYINRVELKDLLQQPGWFIISAMREELGNAECEANMDADADMFSELHNAGPDMLHILSGVYKGERQGLSYLVSGSVEEGLEMARRYGQESILTNRGLVFSDGRPDVAADHDATLIGNAAFASDFYSTVLQGDHSFSFSMGLRFDD